MTDNDIFLPEEMTANHLFFSNTVYCYMYTASMVKLR